MRPHRGRSLAARLTAWYVGSALLLVAAATGLLYWALAASLDQEDDEFLADQVRILRVILRERPGDVEALREEVQLESGARRNAQVYMRVVERGGRAAFETSGMAALLPERLFPGPTPAGRDPEEGVAIRAADGREFRAVSAWARGAAAGTPECVVQVAIDRTAGEDLLAGFRRTILLVLVAALLVAAAFGYAIARRGLRPVAGIAEAARRIGSSTLDRRIGLDGLPAELVDLGNTFNDMLGRLEESFQRLSRFSGDLAHELRTPVANLRGGMEVALGKTRSPDEYRDALGSALEECARLARIIDSLLFIARAENSSEVLERSPRELGAELRAACEFFDASAHEAGVELKVDAPEPVSAAVDRTLLQRALGNLLDNALAHTPRGGSITASVRAEGQGARLAVADTGCGIAAEHLPHVFERFYRADRSRTAGAAGAGLGLAIVRSIAVLHGGSVEISSVVAQGTRVSILLPAIGPAGR